MIIFENDYCEGCCPEILSRLTETNMEQTATYGEDLYCASAREKIRAACLAPGADVHFLVGGTQANATVISAALRPHQGVISAVSGHISGHESGAIEATGHKVLALEAPDGKLRAEQVRAFCEAHWSDVTREHTVQPGMVYISQPTESGTQYSLAELEALAGVCRERGLMLFTDGARLGYSLAAEGNDVTLSDLARLCDVFYIGGTKVGALFGEAVVITNAALKRDFRSIMKQRGGLMAKGRLLGLQFDALFTDGLYERLSRHAVELASELRAAFAKKGWAMRYDTRAAQVFPIVPDAALSALSDHYTFSFWEKTDENRTAVRFCVSWATRRENVERLIRDVEEL